MSNNIIEPETQNAGDVTCDANTVEPQQEPSPDSLSAEARSWRLKYRDAQATAAQAVQDAAAVAEKLRTAERQLVDQHIAARIVSTEDFWSRTEHTDLTGDDGNVDLAKVDAHLAGMLADRPHWAAPGPDMPLAAPAASVTSDGLIGHRATSMLDPSRHVAQDTTWGHVLGDAAQR